MRGRLITIEGLDGAGKTTLADALAEALRARGADVELLREPGRRRAGRADPRARQGPRAATSTRAPRRCSTRRRARSSSPSALRRCCDAGRWVLLDRFVDSSLAYQGGGASSASTTSRRSTRFATGGLTPDRTLLLRVEPARGPRAPRRPRRGAGPPRARGRGLLRRAGAAYDALAAADPERIRVIDAGGAPDAVLAGALAALEDLGA